MERKEQNGPGQTPVPLSLLRQDEDDQQDDDERSG